MLAVRIPSGPTAAPRQAHPSSSSGQRQVVQPLAASLKRSTSTTKHSTDRPRTQSQRSTSPPPPVPAAPAAPVEPVKKEKTAKLTEQWGEPPTVIKRESDSLRRGELLGEGGFARVYLATEPDGTTKAVKVISKEQLKSSKAKGKLFGEIKIHQAMVHSNIISFEKVFEDTGHVYMQLELCANGSLLDLLRKRRRYTEPEARFYLVQLIGACEYMHSNSVIHRDLKLGNLMLDADMNLRVGDFGLAALVKHPGERKRTICGTPNYIAPEILFDTTNGHSFEVDIWSIGVILYTLLVGKPPFQTKDVKNIYRKIKDNNYVFPPEIELSVEAVDLVSSILTTQPDQRPTLSDILAHPFFLTGPFPPSISPSCMTTPPDYRQMSIRSSHRNFLAVKRLCGIVDVDPAAPATVAPPRSNVTLGAVAEEDEEEPPAPVARSPPVLVAAKGTASDAKGMESEVRQALQPGSPISELLRSARKPLIVSPNAEPRELLQRKQLADARTSGPLGASNGQARPRTASSSSRQKENAPPVPPKENVTPSKATTTVAPKHRRQVVPVAANLSPLPPPKTTTVVDPVSTRFPARELYELTWRALDGALNIATTAALEALPSPLPLEPPRVFIMSWVDYTHKYGTAYSLTDGSAGLYYNDSTTMVLSPDKTHFDYISNRAGNVYSRRHYEVKKHPTELERKVYLLEYFENYMSKTLLRDVDWTFADVQRTRNMDFLVKYYRMKNAIVFKMSNDVLQFNFYDHTKLLLTQNASVVTFIDPDFVLRTYSLQGIFRDAARYGFYSSAVDSDPKRVKKLEHFRFLIEKLEYCRDVLRSLSNRKPSSSTATAAGVAVASA
ncbi:hypothetical protein RQP46_001282 [Phenoliferia psychrophenolica]